MQNMIFARGGVELQTISKILIILPEGQYTQLHPINPVRLEYYNILIIEIPCC